MGRIKNPSGLNPPPSNGRIAIRASRAVSAPTPRGPTGKSRWVTPRVDCKNMLPEPHYLLATKSGNDPNVFPDALAISRVPGPIAGDNRLYCTIVDL